MNLSLPRSQTLLRYFIHFCDSLYLLLNFYSTYPTTNSNRMADNSPNQDVFGRERFRHDLSEIYHNKPQPTAKSWEKLHPSGSIPQARSGAASAVANGKLYVFGGYGGRNSRLDDFHCYDFKSNEWNPVEVRSHITPGCRENNGIVSTDSGQKLILFGGYSGTSWLNDLWVYDISEKTWECVEESSDYVPFDLASNPRPSRRFGYVSVVHGNKLIIMFGFDGSQWLNDIYEFNFDSLEWQVVISNGDVPSRRSCPAWVKNDHMIYVHGGYNGINRLSDLYSFNIITRSWNRMVCKGNPPSPRYLHSSSLYNGKLFIYAGYSENKRLDDMYIYDLATEHWSPVLYSDGPTGRSSHCLHLYENMIFVSFGYDGNDVLNDIYKFRLSQVLISQPSLRIDMRRLIGNEEFSDVTFLIEGTEIHANRAILAVRSEYFQALLFGSYKQGIQSHHEAAAGISSLQRQPIEIKGISCSAFKMILVYLYTDAVEDVDLDLGIELLISSDRLMLDRLKALCEEIIIQKINIKNVFDVLLSIYHYNANHLKDWALEFILDNLNNSSVSEGLSSLKIEPDLLIEIIQHKSFRTNLRHGMPVDNQESDYSFSSRERMGSRR